MNYIIAVSGGVDSVVLLDMMAKQKKDAMFIVAHFDHGIRKDSAADARFVELLAEKYKQPFVMKREELGPHTSEAIARTRRYAFLKELALKHHASIVTAHHQDDLVETIAINFTRGTGWRGLAVFGDNDIVRPLLAKRKNELYAYAVSHQLEWVEDETNATDAYLRNRLRYKMKKVDKSTQRQLVRLRQSQRFLGQLIEKEALQHEENVSRYFFIMIAEAAALELLRRKTKSALTKPQLVAFLHGIKTAKAGAVLTLGAGMIARINQRDFSVETPARML